MSKIDSNWLKNNHSSPKLVEKCFFTLNSVALFLPSLAALRLLNRAVIIPHSDNLYEMEQIIVNEKTIAYMIYMKCPFIKVFENGMILHARKRLDKKEQQSVELHNNLPHFQIVNSADRQTTIFCRDVTSVPKT